MPERRAATQDSPIHNQSASATTDQTAGSKILSAIVLALGIIAAVTTAWIAVEAYSPVMAWDQWTIVDFLIRTHDHPTLRQLWEQHHEHRILVGRLLCLADLFYFGGRNISLLIEIFLVQALHLSLLIWVVRRYARLTAPAFITVAGLLTNCLFSPLQMENFGWGFQITFVMASFAVSACFAAALWYSDLPASAYSARVVRLFLCLLAACVAEASLANGLLAWPFLLLLGFLLRFGRREMWIIGVTGFAAIALYMIGYRTPVEHSNPLVTIRQPLAVAKYLVTYFGFSWDAHLPNPSAWPVLAESASALAIVAVLVGGYRCFSKRDSLNRIEAFLFTILMFLLMSATTTALGRVGMGYWQATGSRYQLFALLFWGCLGVLIVLRLEAYSRYRWPIWAVQGLLVLLLAGAGSRYSGIASSRLDRKAALDQGFAALAHQDDQATSYLFYEPEKLPMYYAYLFKHHWGPLELASVYARVEPSAGAKSIEGYQLVSQSRCTGFLDGVERLGNSRSFALNGWAWDLDAESVPLRVAVAASSGKVIGFGAPGFSRPDVAKVNPKVDEDAGWRGTFQIPNNGTYSVFAILRDRKSACPLANILLIESDSKTSR